MKSAASLRPKQMARNSSSTIETLKRLECKAKKEAPITIQERQNNSPEDEFVASMALKIVKFI